LNSITEIEQISSCFYSHNEIGRLIVFEGIPGAGKTAAINEICRGGSYPLISQLDHLKSFFSTNKIYRKNTVNYWYLDMELNRQDLIHQFLKLGKHVFQDRNIISTLAFVYAGSNKEGKILDFFNFIELIRQVAKGRLVRPNLIIVLDVSLDVSISRRKHFIQNSKYNIWFDQEFLFHFQFFYNNYLKLFFPNNCITINTTHLNLKHAILRIKKILNSKGYLKRFG